MKDKDIYKLLDAIGMVGDDLIAASNKRAINPWRKRIIIIAAVLLLAIPLSIPAAMYFADNELPGAPTEAPTHSFLEPPTEKPTEGIIQVPTEAPTSAPTERPTEIPTEPPIDCTHEITEIVISTPPSCTAEGLSYERCTACGETVAQKTIAMLAHTPNNTTVCTEPVLCTVCSFEISPMLGHLDSSVYRSSSAKHWKECPRCAEGYDYADHDFTEKQNTTCAVCGCSKLDYTSMIDEQAYKVTGIGFSTDVDVLIPSSHNGYPVTAIADGAFANTGITSIVIPDTITSIGRGVFEGCNNLTSITLPFMDHPLPYYFSLSEDADASVIPESLKTVIITGGESIPVGAFEGCTSITSVVLPNTLTSISQRAFAGSKIPEILIPSSVTCIWKSAFEYCETLKLSISSCVTTIGDHAFLGCTVTELLIPSTVTSIGNAAFDSDTISFNEYNGARYLGNLENPYHALISAAGVTTDTLEIHPDTVVIATNAVSKNNALKSITFHEKLTHINDNAFSNCTSLTEFVCDGIANIKSIGKNAFYGCSSLKTVSTSSTLTTIGEYAFGFCKLLEHINLEGIVGEIPMAAFTSCYSLNNITVGDGVTAIGSEAFRKNYALTNINLSSAITSIGDFAFSYCSSLEAIAIPDGTTEISQYAFAYCRNLISVTVPSTVNKIGESAFLGCYKLVEVIDHSDLRIYPGSDQNGGIAYYAAEVHTGDSKLVTYGDYLFYDGEVNRLVSYNENEAILTLPSDFNGEKYGITSGAFYNNTTLVSVTIPDGVTTIGEYAFDECTALTTVYISGKIDSIRYHAFYNCPAIQSISLPVKISDRDGVQYPMGYIFGGNTGTYELKTVNQSYLVNGDRRTKSYVIPASIEHVTIFGDSVSYAMFEGFSSLVSVTFADSISSIEACAFQDCYALAEVHITDLVTWIESDFESNPLQYAHDLYVNGELVKDLVIPDGITKIGDYTFKSASITSVVIPDSVTSIGANAFIGCKSLQAVDFGHGLNSIGGYAFKDCDSLVSVFLPDSVVSLGSYAFDGCDLLQEASTGNGLSVIPSRCFYNCPKLSALYLGDSVTVVDECDVFSKGSDYSPLSIYVSDISVFLGIDWICDHYTFSVRPETHIYANGELVEHLVIPDDVTEISQFAFARCVDLKSITLNSNITSIGRNAFYECTLDAVYIPDIAQFLSIDFGNETANPTYVTNEVYIGGDLLGDTLEIPYGTTKIGSYAILNKLGIKELIIPETVTDIQESSLKYGYYPSLTVPTHLLEGKYLNKGGVSELKLIGKRITLTSDLVSGFKSLKSVNFGDSVSIVATSAFASCKSLSKVTFESGNMSVGSDAFKGCPITEVHVSDINEWVTISFARSTGYSGPCSNPATIAGKLYCNGEEVTKVIITEPVASIGQGAFYGLTSITEIQLPDTITAIGECAFYGCTSLEQINLPSSLVTIKKEAFKECTTLETLIIPKSVLTIEQNSILGCPNLTIYCEAEQKPAGWFYVAWNQTSWNPDKIPVVWGYTGSEENTES
ncbi:MAG: leucine-rich repeat protein [Clostridia bacterium]|nr:leucine-rich repeat protein [Clostridia bacterium]